MIARELTQHSKQFEKNRYHSLNFTDEKAAANANEVAVQNGKVTEWQS